MSLCAMSSNTVSRPELTKLFVTLELCTNATLEQVDEKYFGMTQTLQREKRTNRESAVKKQKELDTVYHHLLRYFIFDNTPGQNISYTVEDITNHRDIVPPKRQRLFANGARNIETQSISFRNTGHAQHPEEKADAFEMCLTAAGGSRYQPVDHEESGKLVDTIGERVAEYKLNYRYGDIHGNVPDGTVIVHATNCMGVWGAGFASVLKAKLPAAYRVYASKSKPKHIGECLLIPPQLQDYSCSEGSAPKPRIYVACLFTSVGYGERNANNRGRDASVDIIMNTDSALVDLRNQLETADEQTNDGNSKPGDIYSNKFNSGLFQVPWNKTEELVKQAFKDCRRTWTVFELERSSRTTQKHQTG